MNETNPVLSARKLRKCYGGQPVVDGLNLSIRRGECFGLLGPNGAGKTTTLRLLLGLIAPDAGELRLLDYHVPEEARPARLRVGVVPQMDNLDPDFTVAENLLVYGRYFGMSDAAIEARLPELLEFASLTGKRDARVPTLSGGMKRRLTLARALVNDPEVIFLDEPTTGLDPQARHLIWQRLRELTARGKTLLLTTHFMDEAERLCHRLAVMDNGRLISEGSPRELIEQNIEPQVVEVFGEHAAAWAQDHAARHAQRFEISGESVFCYVLDAQPLLAELQQHPQLRYLHRPANLEDVFLKLTGREMRE
ncbi:MAG: nodulation factor ABC transporter ATP-binding protein NodI [Gallionellales bacterium RIFCSPLOWO2_12_FULL_59_22]|nr:MAG: nodulation factor ABC transporter ATP-binding protein NodI [Gallionellales bacterium RIFCSPLOWO2_02_FULL_59_110]OGT02222.1 MAG: nodulation factor ABC transporter ATP-binding protein NodI [Gallionellales bacterium RIFCSPLOWO2_02_58_13]OGT14364.1 MAG: nodulation factor ABC transporter ATP-binding protein NodI [Gallionellales bacterium RIFCSPLOWO2_12_FULL_59_22]